VESSDTIDNVKSKVRIETLPHWFAHVFFVVFFSILGWSGARVEGLAAMFGWTMRGLKRGGSSGIIVGTREMRKSLGPQIMVQEEEYPFPPTYT